MADAEAAAGHEGPTRPDPTLYPDIAGAGSLQNALQAAFDRAGHRLAALPERAPGWRYVGARIENPHRNTNIVMGARERAFVTEFWSAGICMAHGHTADLPAVASATHLWQTGSRVRELNAAWPFVRFDALAEAHERGEAAKYTWQSYHDNPQQAPHLVRLHTFIARAVREPRLCMLLPFTSMETLGFSRTAGYPHSGGYPWVKPVGEDCYLVMGPDGRELGTADAAGSLALVLAALPSN
jgi:hypothetical protein